MIASTTLHELLSMKMWDEAMLRIRSHPAEVAKICSCRSLTDDIQRRVNAYPLHNACYLNAPYHLILALIDSFPRAVKIPDTGYNRLPIHHAILGKGDPKVVDNLLDRYPESNAWQDGLGRVPLHYALFCQASSFIIEKMIGINSKVIQVQDRNGWTPLHLAGAVSLPTHVVRALVFACPEVLTKVDAQGFCPRDFFIIHDTVDMDVIEFLVEITPKDILMAEDILPIYEMLLNRSLTNANQELQPNKSVSDVNDEISRFP
jgi:hypothetical protein